MSNQIGNHPNALVAGTSGGGGGVLVVWVLGLLGVAMEPEIGALIAGGVATAALLIGKKGIRGVAHTVWRGSS